MKNYSYWEKTSFLAPIDFAIVGSGITGLNAALMLRSKHPKARIAVFERGMLPSGASTKNAGFACFGSISELLSDLVSEPETVVKDRVALRYEGIKRLQRDFPASEIGYESTGNFEFYREDATFQKCLEKMEYFNDWMWEMDEIRPFSQVLHPSRRLIKNSAEGVLHSGKLVSALLKKCRLHNIELFPNCAVQHIDGNQLVFQNFSIEFETCLVATNGFARHLLPEIHVKPARGYIFVSQPISGFDWIGGFHVDEGYIYFRHVDGNRLLLGGARHQDIANEETTEIEINAKIKSYLLDFAQSKLELPPINIEHEWVGFMGFTDSKSPIIKEIQPRLFVAAGLSGIGVATGVSVAERVVGLMG